MQMDADANRKELVVLVERLMSGEGAEREVDDILLELKSKVIHPRVIDLIYYCNEEMTAEQIVDKMLEYKPILL